MINNVNMFIPHGLIENVFSKIDSRLIKTLDSNGETITHDDIIARGVSQSIVSFFYEQTNGSKKVNLTKADNDYYTLRNLYYDYYDVWLCNLEIDSLIKYQLKTNVALVDLDPKTKDFPYAHFDGETFLQSNTRVIDMTNKIYSYLSAKNYEKARDISGQVLHTIQDFYSHSNWIEMVAQI